MWRASSRKIPDRPGRNGAIKFAATFSVILAMFGLIRLVSGDPAPSPTNVNPEKIPQTSASFIAEDIQSSAIRDITPDKITRAYLTAAPASQKPKTSIHIERATIKSNAVVTGTGGSVRLYGIAFPPQHEICNSITGDRWPCGRRVFISFFNKVNSEMVGCEPRLDTNPPAADCYIGDLHIVKWMLSEGLGRLTVDVTDKELRAVETAAKNAKTGIWSDARISSAAAPIARP